MIAHTCSNVSIDFYYTHYEYYRKEHKVPHTMEIKLHVDKPHSSEYEDRLQKLNATDISNGVYKDTKPEIIRFVCSNMDKIYYKKKCGWNNDHYTIICTNTDAHIYLCNAVYTCPLLLVTPFTFFATLNIAWNTGLEKRIPISQLYDIGEHNGFNPN